MASKAGTLEKGQDQISCLVFSCGEVVPCEVRTFRALLQHLVQLPMIHVYDLAVAWQVLNLPQNFDCVLCFLPAVI